MFHLVKMFKTQKLGGVELETVKYRQMIKTEQMDHFNYPIQITKNNIHIEYGVKR